VLNGGTSIISIEDTHNGAGGVVIPLENLAETKKLAEKHGLLVHMDGARIFNAAVALGVTVAEVAKHVDSLSFCLSKGLACPLGAVICGTAEMIDRARHVRQVLGGGMRQAGVMAQTGIWALDNMVERLSEDHENASLLAQLAVEAGFGVNLDSVQTNMVRVNTSPLTSEQFRQNLLAHGIDVLVAAPDTVRFVTHWGITREHILETGELMKQMQK